MREFKDPITGSQRYDDDDEKAEQVKLEVAASQAQPEPSTGTPENMKPASIDERAV